MSTLLLLASESQKAKTLWDPTILGLLVFVSAVGLFCGSVYLLLSTNLGARLGFLVSAACLSGFMVLLSLLWVTTATPLNGPKGRIPQWKVKELITRPSESKIGTVRSYLHWTRAIPDMDLANLRPAMDAALVKAQPAVNETAPKQPLAQFSAATEYLTGSDYALLARESGGGGRLLVFHKPHYAVVQICRTAVSPVDASRPPAAPKCDAAQPTRAVVLEKDLGSLRQPPIFYFLGSLVLFLLSLRGLHWYEQDERARESAAATPGS